MSSDNLNQHIKAGSHTQVREIVAIILAGGLGTRLRDTLPNLPKCMAPVGGRPFLSYVINYLRSEGIEKFIFSLGYKNELITEYLADHFATLDYTCVTEEEPMGTGGAIKLACSQASGKNVLVVNGDTLFKINLSELYSLHHEKNAFCTIALKPMKKFDRYGSVLFKQDKSICGFKEKQFLESGYINGGSYLLNKDLFEKEALPETFSFEKDYLEKFYPDRKMFALVQDTYFIDIGIPDAYRQAAQDLVKPILNLHSIDKSWTLFLDRDGVINHEKKDDYIRNWQEFQFYDGVTEAIKKLSSRIGKIFIVTNQRGVERGFMSESDLSEIHTHMQLEIEKAGGRIDKIFYCTSIDNIHAERKPNPGMAFRAKIDFPDIDLSKSLMAGNKLSDMRFGRHGGMYTAYIKTTHPEQTIPHPDIDLSFDSLYELAKAL